MTHNPEENATMMGGTGFVLVEDEDSAIENVLRRRCRIGKIQPREAWPGIEDDVAELERLLR